MGRPGLFATTKQFLDDLGISSLDQLPSLNNENELGASIQRLEHLVDDSQLEIDLAGLSVSEGIEGVQVESVVRDDSESHLNIQALEVVGSNSDSDSDSDVNHQVAIDAKEKLENPSEINNLVGEDRVGDTNSTDDNTG